MKSWETGQTSLSTEIKLDPTGEFVNYWLEGERVDLTVPMKEFRVGSLRIIELIAGGLDFGGAARYPTLSGLFVTDSTAYRYGSSR